MGDEKKTGPGPGMLAGLYLDDFGALVRDAFGDYPYHVGSSMEGKAWRDVDVRLMLEDAEYERQGFGDPDHPWQNPKWVAMVKAFSALGQQLTGLPVDFQIQQVSRANAREDKPRSCLGLNSYFRVHPPEERAHAE